MNIEDIIKNAIENTLNESGLKQQEKNKVLTGDNLEPLNESYVIEAGKFNLHTELLSSKTKKSHQELMEGYVKKLNEVSIKLDGSDKSNANLNNS